MARHGREKSEIGVYHILLRGVNILFKSDDDFTEFTDILKKYALLGNIELYCYSLLKNRIHLVVGADEIGKALKPICTSYARYFNRTHMSSGKIFYDRFKSEPINTLGELSDVVAFINSISKKAGNNYAFCSLSPLCKEFCNTSGKLTKKQFENTAFSNMYIEDFDCLSQKELAQYIFEITGVMPKDFKNLSSQELDRLIKKLTEKHWISRTKLFEILGIRTISKPQAKAPKKQKTAPMPQKIKETPKKEKPEPKPEPKKELSIWLL